MDKKQKEEQDKDLDWESAEDSGELDKRLNAHLKITSESVNDKKTKMSSDFIIHEKHTNSSSVVYSSLNPCSPPFVPQTSGSINSSFSILGKNESSLPKEDDGRTPYQPTIKILKRPQSNAKTSNGNNQNHYDGTTRSPSSDHESESCSPAALALTAAPAQPPQYKSLEQRQLEYAQARMRILGSAHDGDTSLLSAATGALLGSSPNSNTGPAAAAPTTASSRPNITVATNPANTTSSNSAGAAVPR